MDYILVKIANQYQVYPCCAHAPRLLEGMRPLVLRQYARASYNGLGIVKALVVELKNP